MYILRRQADKASSQNKLQDKKEQGLMEPTPHFIFSPEVLFQPLGDEAVLLNLQNNRYYGLNEVGARMWQLLQEHGELDAVVAQMVVEYEVDDATLRQDLQTLIAQLLEQEMLAMDTATGDTASGESTPTDATRTDAI